MKAKKTFKCFVMVVMIMTMNTTISAQSKADLKAAKKEAKSQKKEGWKVNPGYLSLEEQIAISKPVLRNQEEWIIGEAKTTGSVYDAARSNALMQAKVNLAKVVDEKVGGNAQLGEGNDQQSGNGSVAATRFRETARSKFANEIKRPKMLMDCYRNLKNGNVEVHIRIAMRWDEAQIAYENMMKELKDMMEKNK